MRTNIDIDDDLMAKAAAASVAKTKKGVVVEALRLLVRMHAQGELRQLFGKLRWDGSLDEMRRDWCRLSTRQSGSTILMVKRPKKRNS